MATQLITASYSENLTVSFTNNAWFNATTVAKHFNKKPVEWLRLESTIDYIKALVEIQKWENPTFDENQLVSTKKGSSENGGGTWLHPKLAVAFARWLDVRFAIWCDMQIEKILHPAFQHNPEPPTKKSLPNGLSLEQQDTIKALIKSRAESLPKEQQGKAIITCWSALKTKFGYKKPETYKNIKPEDFNTAISLLARLPLDGELIGKQQHNQITITLAPRQAGEGMIRYVIDVYGDDAVQMWKTPKGCLIGTFEGITEDLDKRGYAVIEKSMLEKLQSKIGELLA